jgi:bacterioferritin-associated ferredoxin
MVWAGTGVLWTIDGGVPKSLGLVGEALAKHLVKEVSGLTFLQISDSHIGFDKPEWRLLYTARVQAARLSIRNREGRAMIVCSCNILTDAEIRKVIADHRLRTPSGVHGCLGCRPRCGSCLKTISAILSAYTDTAKGRGSQAANDSDKITGTKPDGPVTCICPSSIRVAAQHSLCSASTACLT